MLRQFIVGGIATASRTSSRAAVVASTSKTVSPAATCAFAGLGSPQDQGACRFRSNRSRRGLYDGKDIRSGNNVSFSMKATKRKFKPNVFKKRVYSEVLDEMVRFHVTTTTLRSIDKAGGLDNYLLTSSHVTSGEGLTVKKRIVSKLAYEERETARAEAEETARAGDESAAK